jgi:hypothetical protein
MEEAESKRKTSRNERKQETPEILLGTTGFQDK